MKKNMLFGLVLIIVCLLIGLFFLRNTSKDVDDDVIMKISIYPTAVLDETYLFVVRSDKMLEVSKGVRKHQTFDFHLRKVIDIKKRKLTAEESKVLLDAANRIEETSDNITKKLIEDGWDVSIYYKGKIMDLHYYGNESKDLDVLVNQLILLSPITVDLHGWS
ncbi:hypothetical protein PAALTS15_06499 [Paenibacillus alvei TS-15]|uniref:Uncharacterized protein n=1 Tax=Paenibacillus alvei TS-15 TaxID=1117108 RepID=S9SQX7_PAEAL|nr:hypothetical protein [Paenibacillus alvei]EPY08102.1 hypothetical protein PAALTS15_06499 [Paenibacillus alvei TS-15]